MTNAKMKILLVEDNPGDMRLLEESLREIGCLQFELFHSLTLGQALVQLPTQKPDIGLLDLGLPDAYGLEVVRRVHHTVPDMPLVVLTALDDEALAVQSLQEGAQDYLVKANLDSASLWRALRYAMERQRLQLQAISMSLVDDLTGLNNRKGFLNLAEHHIRMASRAGTPFLVGFVDLDGMKQINDTFGHQEGNRALVEAANVLKDSFRQSDILGRLGGDEFAVLITDASEQSATTVIDRVKDKLHASNTSGHRAYKLSMSVGIVPGNLSESPNLEALLQRADELMYQQKNEKRGSRQTEAGSGLLQ